jgi:Tol biopolymer transport system component
MPLELRAALEVGTAISPDGRYLAYANRRHLVVQTIDGHSAHILSRADGLRVIRLSWTNDSAEILFAAIVSEKETPSLWRIPIVGNDPPRRIIDDAYDARLSPNGEQLAVVSADRSRLTVMRPNGEDTRTLLNTKMIGAVAWSEDSTRIWLLDHFEDDWRLLQSVRPSDGQPGPTYRLHWGDGLDMIPDGRLVYTAGGADGGIFEASADPKNGRVDLNKPRKIGETGSGMMISTTRDGSRICFLHGAAESDVHVGELKDGNRKLINARRLTLNDAADLPHAWTPDSKTVIFESDRSGSWSIYSQPFDGLDAQLLVPGGDSTVFGATVPPDGLSMLYRSTLKATHGAGGNPTRVMRLPFSGGAPSEVFTLRAPGTLHCPSHGGQCVLSEQTGDKVLFSYFDPVRGRQGEFRPAETFGAIIDWDISPDGSTLALLPKTGDDNHIALLSGREARQDLLVTGITQLRSVNWWANGRGFFAAANGDAAVLASISISGEGVILTREVRSIPSWAVPSPDGKKLAYVAYPDNYQAWMLADF